MAGLISAVLLGGYACMTGMSVSTQRALLMFALHLGADAVGRVYDLPTALSVAAAGIAAENPASLIDAGFLMSFGAILGILILYPIFQETFARENRFLQAVSGSLAITVFLYPVTSFFYYECSPYAIFLNLIVIPLMSWILGAGIVGLFFAFLWLSGGKILFKSCGFLLEIYEVLCRMVLRFPNAVIVTGKPKLWRIIIYYCLLVMFVYWWNRKKAEEKRMCRRKAQKKEQMVHWRQKVKMILWLLGLTLFLTVEFSKKELEVTFLDVGQGDGIFIRTDSGLTCMVDGGSTDVKQVGTYRIEPFLKAKGVNRLDYVFITHGDQDHLNGIAELLTRQSYGIKVDTLVLPRKEV